MQTETIFTGGQHDEHANESASTKHRSACRQEKQRRSAGEAQGTAAALRTDAARHYPDSDVLLRADVRVVYGLHQLSAGRGIVLQAIFHDRVCRLAMV